MTDPKYLTDVHTFSHWPFDDQTSACMDIAKACEIAYNNSFTEWRIYTWKGLSMKWVKTTPIKAWSMELCYSESKVS